MTETQQRKEFEKYALDRFCDCSYTNSIDEEYRNSYTARMWEGWQAGRSSLESENERLREALQKCSEADPPGETCIPNEESCEYGCAGCIARGAIRGGTNVEIGNG